MYCSVFYCILVSISVSFSAVVSFLSFSCPWSGPFHFHFRVLWVLRDRPHLSSIIIIAEDCRVKRVLSRLQSVLCGSFAVPSVWFLCVYGLNYGGFDTMKTHHQERKAHGFSVGSERGAGSGVTPRPPCRAAAARAACTTTVPPAPRLARAKAGRTHARMGASSG